MLSVLRATISAHLAQEQLGKAYTALSGLKSRRALQRAEKRPEPQRCLIADGRR